MMTTKTRIPLAMLTRAANSKSPYAGVPVVHDGSRRPAIFVRKHLLAAIESGATTAVYDHKKLALIVNGSKSSRYLLRDLATSSMHHIWNVEKELQQWASRKRKTDAAKRIPVCERIQQKLSAFETSGVRR